LVNEDLDILQFRGSTGLFLEPAPGKASLNLLKMAKTGLAFELKTAIHKCNKLQATEKKNGNRNKAKRRASQHIH
jgi:two-component system CheB/CheR fusion protein